MQMPDLQNTTGACVQVADLVISIAIDGMVVLGPKVDVGLVLMELPREASRSRTVTIAPLAGSAEFVASTDGIPMGSRLFDRAVDLFDEYEMGSLPAALRRNSLDYYYLSIYPGLSEMRPAEAFPPPAYPQTVHSAYVHIPYCTGVCTFCSYFLTTVDSVDRSPISRYLELVKQEISWHQGHSDLDLSYLYFGGGTPSLIPPTALADFLEFLASRNLRRSSGYGTFELHPEFFNDLKQASEFVTILRNHGIFRVSIGLESSDEALLARTNRRHGTTYLSAAMAFLKQNSMIINLDLMYGLPGLSDGQWESTLVDALACQPDSISAYFLFVDKGTAMSTSIARGETHLPTHQQIQIQHLMTQLLLEEHGYHELPNDFYSRPTADPASFVTESLPSQASSLPLGAGSYGFCDSTQFANTFSLADYRSRVTSGTSPVWRGHRFDEDGLMRRDIMFTLKNSPYLDHGLFLARYGIDPLTIYSATFELLGELQLLSHDRGRSTLTRKGRLCVEEICCLFRIPNLRLQLDTAESPSEEKLLIKHHFAPTYPQLSSY